jgi:hypothetical protein
MTQETTKRKDEEKENFFSSASFFSQAINSFG